MARAPLVARFSADTSRFRSELGNARTFAVREMGQIASFGARSFRALEGSSAASAAAMATNFGRAFLAIKSLSAGLQVAMGAFVVAAAAGAAELERFHKIAERARASEVGATFFQAFTSSARAFRLEIADLESDLAGLGRSVRDAFDPERAGGVQNRARDLLQERFRGTNDFGLSDSPTLFDQARNAEERMRAVLIGLRDMEAAGQRLAAIDMARRLGMDRLANQVDLGRTSFTAFLGEVERLESTGLRDGSIISPELIRSGEELRSRFAAASDELSRNLRPILDECARLALAIGNGAAWSAEQFAALVGVVGRAVSRMRELASLVPGTIDRAVAATDEQTITILQTRLRDAGLTPLQRRGLEEQLRAVEARRAQREASLVPEMPILEAPGPAARTSFSAPVPNPRPAVAPASSPVSSGAASTDQWVAAYKRLIDAMEKANATAQAELATVGASTTQRERALAIARAEAEAKKNGKTLTDEQRAAVGALGEEYGRLQTRIAEAERAQRGMAEALQWTGDQLVDLIANGRSFADIWRGLSAQILRAAITGQGPFAQILGFAPPAGAPQGTLGGLMGLLQPQQVAAPIVAGMSQAAAGMQPLMVNAFGQVASDTQGRFTGVFNGLGGVLQMVLTNAIMASQSAGGFGGLLGLGSSLTAGGALSPFSLYHGGGTAGDRVSGFAPASLWNAAPRYHSGLRTGEIRAVLQAGERVLTQADSERTMRTIAGLSRAASAPAMGRPNVVIHNHAPANVEAREGEGGDLEIMVTAIEGRMAGRAGRREGALYPALGSSLGYQPGTGLRGV